jgi:hypothetical protein
VLAQYIVCVELYIDYNDMSYCQSSCLVLGQTILLNFQFNLIMFLIKPSEITGFGIVKDNGTIHENPVSAENTKVPSLWDDGEDMSPVASSNGHIKDEKPYSGAESEIGYDFGDESVRSPGSAGRSASGSPFKPSRFGMHTSPSKRESYRYLFSHFVYLNM